MRHTASSSWAGSVDRAIGRIARPPLRWWQSKVPHRGHRVRQATEDHRNQKMTLRAKRITPSRWLFVALPLNALCEETCFAAHTSSVGPFARFPWPSDTCRLTLVLDMFSFGGYPPAMTFSEALDRL